MFNITQQGRDKLEKKDYKEYIGQKYNRLTIIDIYRNERNQPYAKCICECGNKKNILLRNVINGKSQSCGCFERESRYNRNHVDNSIIGKKFGRLTVTKDTGKRKSNGSVLWECKCECGNITYSDSSNLKRGHTTSCGCKIDDYIESLKQDIIGKKYNHLTVIKELDRSQYKRRTYLCRCDCGNEIIVSGDSVVNSHTTSCGCIRQSNGEMFIEEILLKHNITYYTEYRFEDCKYKRRLPFDFYLPDYNICIEYQGRQHYESVEYYGGEEGLIIRQERDKIKKEFCKNNNIQLLEIPYTVIKKEEIEEMILNTLNP